MPASRADFEIILSRLMGVDRAFLAIHEPSTEVLEKAKKLMERRKAGEPLAYILGEWEFYGRMFKVTPDTLIPRPETEIGVDLIKELRPKTLLDIGTGSGCIAISAKLESPKMRVVATDVSAPALKVARANAKKFGVAVEFLQADLLEKKTVERLAHMDFLPEVIVANLPYVDENWDWLDQKALAYEPKMALYASGGGLDLIFRLINELSIMTARKKQRLLLEADPCQHGQIVRYATTNGLSHEKTSGFWLVFSR